MEVLKRETPKKTERVFTFISAYISQAFLRWPGGLLSKPSKNVQNRQNSWNYIFLIVLILLKFLVYIFFIFWYFSYTFLFLKYIFLIYGLGRGSRCTTTPPDNLGLLIHFARTLLHFSRQCCKQPLIHAAQLRKCPCGASEALGSELAWEKS